MEVDYYWERIKDLHKFFFGSIAFQIVASTVFGGGVINSFAALLLFAAMVSTPFAFIYYAYKDKQALGALYSGVHERHWLTIAVFMWLTSGLYAFVYTLIRATKYDPVNPEQTQTGAQKLYTAGQSIVKRFDDSAGESGSSSSGSSRVSTSHSDQSSATTSSSSDSTSRSSQSRTQTSTSGGSSASSSASSSSTGESQGSSGGNGRSQSTDGTDTGADTVTNVFQADSDDGTGDTEVYEPAQSDSAPSDKPSRSSSGGNVSGSTTKFCGYCGTDLSQYGEPQFCPECGTEAE